MEQKTKTPIDEITENPVEEKVEQEIKPILNCVRLANFNPDRLNSLGKESLAFAIIGEAKIEEFDVDSLSEEELNEFLKKWGYDR